VSVTGSSSITLAGTTSAYTGDIFLMTGTDASLSSGTAEAIPYANPLGIAFDPSGSNLFIFEDNGGTTPYVEKRAPPFTSTGTAWSTSVQAVGLAVDSSDNVYLTDPTNNKVWKYNSAGVSQASWAGYNSPQEAAVDNTNTYLYVADYADGNIIRTSLTGSGQATFATLPNQYGAGAAAYGVAVDSSGNVFATDGAHDYWYKYDSSGNLLASINAAPHASGLYVQGIAVDANGYVYVATSGTVLEYAPH
jgi:tripartite motif-containing protein 71